MEYFDAHLHDWHDDLIEGILRLMESPEAVAGPINLGSPGEFTVRELAEIVIEMTASRSKIEYHDLPEDDPGKRKPDIQKASELLGWGPAIALRDGLARTIAYFEQRLGKYGA
jgi:UDP-glucuronate decarboxylase